MTEDDGHEFEQALGVGDGQGSLACCSPWSRRVGHDGAAELNSLSTVKFLAARPHCVVKF